MEQLVRLDERLDEQSRCLADATHVDAADPARTGAVLELVLEVLAIHEAGPQGFFLGDGMEDAAREVVQEFDPAVVRRSCFEHPVRLEDRLEVPFDDFAADRVLELVADQIVRRLVVGIALPLAHEDLAALSVEVVDGRGADPEDHGEQAEGEEREHVGDAVEHDALLGLRPEWPGGERNFFYTELNVYFSILLLFCLY